jgi:hypothetical protein
VCGDILAAPQLQKVEKAWQAELNDTAAGHHNRDQASFLRLRVRFPAVPLSHFDWKVPTGGGALDGACFHLNRGVRGSIVVYLGPCNDLGPGWIVAEGSLRDHRCGSLKVRLCAGEQLKYIMRGRDGLL